MKIVKVGTDYFSELIKISSIDSINDSVGVYQYSFDEEFFDYDVSIKNIEELSQFNQAQNVVDGQLASIRLENSLNPKPISFYDDKKHIATAIMNNTTLYCQKKHSTSVTDLAQRLTFNVKGWLDGIESSLVKAPLIS